MPITLALPGVLARFTEGARVLDVSGRTVGEAVANVTQRFPALATRLVDENGEPYPFVTYYLNDEDLRFAGGFGAPVRDGDEITVVSAVAGG